MQTPRSRPYVPLAALAILFASLLVYRPQNAGIWWQTLFDWLHVPVFGLIALVLHRLMPETWHNSKRVAVAFIAAIALACLSEAAQIPLRRSASFQDIMSDVAGAASFLLLLIAAKRGIVGGSLLALAATAIIGWTALPLVAMSNAIAERDARFPVLFGGDLETERALVTIRNMFTETAWDAERGRMYTRLRFIRGLSPRLEFRNVVADWHEKSALVVEFDVPGSEPLQFTLRVHDVDHRNGSQPHNDRYNLPIVAGPGWHSLRIPLRDVAAAPRGRTMNLAAIDGLVLFADAAAEDRILALYEIRLD